MPVRPRHDLLQETRHGQKQCLLSLAPDDLYAQRQSIGKLSQRQRHRRLARDVEGKEEYRVSPQRVICRKVGQAHVVMALGPGRLGQGRGNVDVAREQVLHDLAGRLAQAFHPRHMVNGPDRPTLLQDRPSDRLDILRGHRTAHQRFGIGPKDRDPCPVHERGGLRPATDGQPDGQRR